MDKKNLTESDIRTKFITPAIAGASDKNGRYKKRTANEQAWRVSIDDIKAGNFNLDIKNPHSSDTGPGDVDTLLPECESLLQLIAQTRGKLKAQLESALMGKDVRGKDEG